jgi:hypothetical protein
MPVALGLVGNGVVGGRIAKRVSLLDPEARVTTLDTRVGRIDPSQHDVVVLAHPGPHAELAAGLIAGGTPVVSCTGDLADIRQMWDLDDAANDVGVPLVAGAAQSPGLTDLLARHLADQLEECDEIHLAVHGTAGPACAREHHRALSGYSVALHDGDLVNRRSGSGRELCWFPEPVGAYDCYRAELASPVLLSTVFPHVRRLTGRQSANRRDRLTARLPMLTPPHAEGGVGAVRVEVRGTDADGARVTIVGGAAELVGTSAAATACAFALAAANGELPSGVVCTADDRLDTRGLLTAVQRFGVRLQEFTGIPSSA